MKKLVTIAAVLAAGVALAEVSWKKTPMGLEVKADGVTRALSFYGEPTYEVTQRWMPRASVPSPLGEWRMTHGVW